MKNRYWLLQVSFALFVSIALNSELLGHDPDGDDTSHVHSLHSDSQHGGAVMTTRPEARLFPPAKEEDVFHFVVYGDRTSGVAAGLDVLRQAVIDTNLIDPDLVMTVGDMVQGYNEQPEWLAQMQEYKAIMDRLNMRWYPVAGNHDVYWRGEGAPPEGHHEADYEEHFGPLWYSLRHKNAGFIALYSDEGDRANNRKGFNEGEMQRMSDEQLAFLKQALSQLSDADHIFLFLHHPRWIGGGYAGGNWDVVHAMLAEAGNVTAVFAGHIHHMRYDGPQDDIEYYTLATTGGKLNADFPDAGYLHHLNLVTVRRDRISVAALPIGSVVDPKQFTPLFLEEVAVAQSVQPTQDSPAITLQTDGSAKGEVSFSIHNPAPRPLDITASFHVPGSNSPWRSNLDHTHVTVDAGQARQIIFAIDRAPGNASDTSLPVLRVQREYVGEASRVRLPEMDTAIQFRPADVSPEYFLQAASHCLLVTDEQSAVRIPAAAIAIPDGPLTLEAWVQPDNLSGSRGIVAKTQSSEYAIFANDGIPKFSVHLNGRYVGSTATAPLDAGKWTHLAGVYDGQQVMLFVNGSLVNAKPATGRRTPNQLPLYIGADPDGQGRPTRAFSGLIDEVRISQAAIYRDTFEPLRKLQPTDETVMLMHLDSNIGPFVLDHSPSAATGTLGSTAQLVPVEQ